MRNLRLGQLITHLKATKEDSVMFDFCDFVPDSLMSYRGYYEQLAVTPQEWKEVLVNDFLQQLKAAVGAKFSGYKGGEYIMHDNTPVWVSEYGRASGTGIVGVRGTGWGRLILETAYCEE